MLFTLHMSDSSHRTPPFGTKKPPRVQSQDDRDAEGLAALAARRDREGSVKEFAKEEITGRYEGEELDERRSGRPDVERIGRLEKKHDELKQDFEKKHDELKRDVGEVRSDVKTISGQVSDMRADVSGAVGKLDGQQGVLKEMLSLVKKSASQSLERDHIKVTTMLDVDKAQELAKVEVNKEQQIAQIEVTKEEKVDSVKAKADRRKRNLKILGLIAGGGTFIELLHRLWEFF